jgi:hypothetical protein
LEENTKLKISKITPQILYNSENRYRRYLRCINDWTDRKGTDYSYIKEKIYEYVSEKNIVFTPIENINYLKESFGLNSFVSPAIKREQNVHHIETAVKVDLPTLEAETTIQLPSEVRSGRPYLRYAAILILGLGITGTVGYKIYENQVKKETLLVETAVQKQVQNKIQEATFLLESPITAVTLTVSEEKMLYHVVAGAFRSEENAQNIYADLLKSGFKARRIGPNKYGLLPVLYGSYATYQEAQNAMLEIQKANNPDAWLMVKAL